MKLNPVEVFQGNINGASIGKNSGSILFTTDMVGCISICIEAQDSFHMIHSDTSRKLQEGIEKLNLDLTGDYKIALYGGVSIESLKEPMRLIECSL